MEKEKLSENTKTCSKCGHPIDMTGNSVVYGHNGHFFHENHFNLRPRWELKDKDKGMAFYRKGNKRMDILEGEDDERKTSYRDIIIYDSNLEKDVLVRSKKGPLNGKIK